MNEGCVKHAEAELYEAESSLADARRKLREAQEWVRNAEQVHAQRQRELVKLLEQATKS